MDKPEHAVIIKKVLDVDPELKPSLITREIEAHPDGTLLMYGLFCIILPVSDLYLKYRHFEATELRTLRVASNSILELLHTIMQTIEQFPPP